MGAAGGVIIFMFLGVGQIIFSLCVLGYAAHCLCVVLEQTASGNDEVTWPDEPYVDWMWQLAYLAFLVAVSVIPTVLLVGNLDVTLPTRIALLVGIPWLLFPINLLSSMSGASRLVVLRPAILRGLLRRPDRLVVFYLTSGLVWAGIAWLYYQAFRDANHLLIFLAGLALAAGFLIYGRMLGRVAWLMILAAPAEKPKSLAKPVTRTIDDRWPSDDDEEQTFRTDSPLTREKSDRPKKAAKRKVKVQDPWATPTGPPIDAEPPKPDRYHTKEVYKVSERAPDPIAPAAKEVSEPGYVAMPAPSVPAGPANPEAPTAIPGRVARFEEELQGLRDEPTPPSWPLVTGVYSFPFYPACRGAFAALTGGFTLVGGVFVILAMMWPF
jgi:hypothetical protein